MCNLSWGIYQDGVEEGFDRGIEQTRKEITLALYQDGMPLEKIARIVSESLSTVQEWLSEASVAAEPASDSM